MQALYGSLTHDLCDTGTFLYQLSYEENQGTGHFVGLYM